MLPGRAAVLDHLAGQLPGEHDVPRALVLVGLIHRDDETRGAAEDTAVGVLSATVRRDDWLGRSGDGEFAAVLVGTTAEAETAAIRLVTGIGTAGDAALSAAAGVAVLSPGLSPAEALRRATLSLAVARSMGCGQVIRYTGRR